MLTNLPVRCIVTDVEICYKVFSQMVIICEKNRAQPRFFRRDFSYVFIDNSISRSFVLYDFPFEISIERMNKEP